MFFSTRKYFDAAAGIGANPSSPHEEGREAHKMLEDARTRIARLLEVQSDDVIFTSGATEANALAILGYVRSCKARVSRPHVLYLPSAHASVVENALLLTEEGCTVEPLPIKSARVDVALLEKQVRPETVLISMDAVCGETGVIWNTREVAQVLRKHAKEAVLHVDASQAPLTEKVTRAHFDADLLTLDASKVGTLRGIGALIAHRTIPILPLYKGGGQERGLRPGSEAPLLAQEFAKALASAVEHREQFRTEALRARTHLISAIASAVPRVEVNEGREQSPHIVNFSCLGRDTDYVVALLDEAGCAISTRSACETDSEEGSRAVFALTNDLDRAKSTLRISWDSRVRERDFARLIYCLTQAIAFIDSGGER
jgi:cysteine desulfurase